MELRQRLARLTGGHSPSTSPTTTTRERLDVLLDRSARSKAGPKVSDEEVAVRMGGMLVAPGVVLFEHFIPLDHSHGQVPLRRLLEAPLEALAPSAPKPADLLFLDTETTGLAGGTGTLPFLLGLARLDEGCLRVRQYLLTGFAGEPAVQERVRTWLETGRLVVSYNGKSFDLPLLVTRHRLQRKTCPLEGKPHLDLLHPTRAAFATVWPDCRLQQAEARLMGLVRSDDLPGWLVPQVWTDFVRKGVLGDMPRVLEHNLLDVITLAALLAELAQVYAQPGYAQADPHALARSHLRLGQSLQAVAHLQAGRAGLGAAGLLELARLHCRQGDWDKAADIWETLVREGTTEAMLALAKFHEHRTHDYQRAMALCQELIARQPGDIAHQHRLARIKRKSGEGPGARSGTSRVDLSGATELREDGASGQLWPANRTP